MVQYTACKCAARPAGCKASCITALFTQSSYTGKQDYTHHTRSIFLIHRLLSTACIPYHNNENSNLVHFKRKNIIWQFDIFFKSRWQLNLEFGSGNFFYAVWHLTWYSGLLSAPAGLPVSLPVQNQNLVMKYVSTFLQGKAYWLSDSGLLTYTSQIHSLR